MRRALATRSCYLAALITLLLFSSRPGIAWESWGGDPGGSRFSPLREITPDNVGNLVRAFEFHTGDLAARPPGVMRRTKFQATPLFVEDSLVFCSPFNEVIALDPGTGAQKWRYDPKIAINQRPANRYVCRGVTYWIDDQAPVDAACRSRIFMGTNDVRLIALDAKTGIPCAGFGEGGEVRPAIGMKLEWPGEFQITSPPAVGRGVVVVGSAIGDNRRVDAPSGVVRAFDARSGQPRWTFEPLKRDGIEGGHANVWAPMSVDAARGLVFLPTSSPSPDFWGGKRPGNNEHANSVVALRIETGELVWAFQTVHHDVWDYDLPAQPTLTRIDTGDGQRDVVIQPTKQGFVFVLDRDTGKPVWPVEERSVPQGAAEGERLSPTQPFPTHVPQLMSQKISAEDALSLVPSLRRSACEKQFAEARNEGLYTPPSTQGTLEFPFTGGGVNWGSAAFDPVNQVLYANTSRAVHLIKLIPRAEAAGFDPPPGHDFGQQTGAPFAMSRAVAMSPLGLLCNKPPWGEMVAVDLKAGKILWRSTVGTTEDLAPLGVPLPWGAPLVNGLAVTAGGLVFTGAMDAYLRAFDARSGRELWQGRLPVPGVANPMTYLWKGEQYVAIGAGGHSEAGTSIGDSVVAFRLARPGEGPSLWSRTIDRPGGRFFAASSAIALAIVALVVASLRWRRRRRIART
ncbi:pyrroloquinoline quinone-dependent dehydrogenase [Bradyrhizobium canariense]|uniref:Pyrroloquinoline quinone-dependent dehydrogenase n=1 Tax=Bradyrhizobium canariense TaxID=255045 RepID=A0A1X3FXQ2_9BRAD|nr:pyrroloquinoline quinone-dependent dehydrogenase [Bradyrhizobium canariense]OSI80249.1 pyrroloquinoline quinone-dependent dehydrogenase [Bradyrhizobium canariense]OSI91984.1 pyrroloquinoline quinone-dependent dehydrogenase [Bradyrhizobium canariense]OSI93032.1 pyrroloquinoline quinone-dependent dehydrogenase [Bradyrhizobium canariense]OSJ05975.1 pyrroloquinoline quinone-dependent dehydrogenase [Bradyrhizobium canariense]